MKDKQVEFLAKVISASIIASRHDYFDVSSSVKKAENIIAKIKDDEDKS